MKNFLSFYIPVYKKLLDIKEYVKYFDSKSVGAFYRIICSRVWRLDTDETVEEGYRGTATYFLASQYEKGSLVSYITDKELSDLLGVSARHIRRLRTNLVSLGLIEVKREDKKASAYFYKVGKTLKSKTYGKYNEVFFIDKWLKQVDDFNKRRDSTLNIPFVQLLMSVFDHEKEYNVCQEIDSELEDFKDEIFESGHTCPAIRTYMSRSEDEKNLVSDDQDGENKDFMKRPNNNSINNNLKNYQNGLFEEEEMTSLRDLVDNFSSSSRIGGNLLKAVKQFSYDDVKDFLQGKDNSLKHSKTPFADYVMKLFLETKPESKLVTLMWQWWIALSLDFKRPTMRSDATRAKIIFAKIPCNNWEEFRYLVNLAKSKKVQNFASMETPTWLYNLLTNYAGKLDEFREQSVHLSRAEINSSLERVLKDFEEEDKKMKSLVDTLSMEIEDSDFDVEELKNILWEKND